MTNEKAKRIFTGIEHALMGAGALAIILFVHTESYKDEVRMERERLAWQGRRGKCAEEDQYGRQLVATDRGSSDWGPTTLNCYYQGDRQ